MVGAEGTFGVVTKIWVRITRNPSRTARSGRLRDGYDATNTISDIIGSGIVPAPGDARQPHLAAVEAAFHLGFPLRRRGGADHGSRRPGRRPDSEAKRITEVAKKNNSPRGPAKRTPGRAVAAVKSAQAGVRRGRAAGPELLHPRRVVPRTKLPDMLVESSVSHKYDLRICNVFHAGDGNPAPDPAVDERDADQCGACWPRATRSRRIVAASAAASRGEHGIGVEKIDFMPRMFTPGGLA